MFKKIDFFAPKVQFKIGDDNTLKSDFGGYATIFVFLISILAFIGFGIDIFRRLNPTVIVNKVISQEVSYTMTDQNFLFAVYDQYSDLGFEEIERKFEGSMDYFVFFGDGSNERKIYNFEKCSKEALAKWEGNFKNDKNLYYCLPKGTILKSRGIDNVGEFTIFRLQYNYCKNNTNSANGPIKTNCYSREFIEKNITGRIQMHYIMESSIIDTGNYDNPGGSVPFTGLTNTNTNTWNRLTILLKRTQIITDTGFFIKSLRDDNYYGIDSVSPDSIYTLGTNTIFSHYIANSKYQDVYKRNYIKIQDVFALMGGFINGTTLIIKIILKYIGQSDIIDIFNEIYKYREINSNSRKINSIINSTKIDKLDITDNSAVFVSEKKGREDLQTNNYLIETRAIATKFKNYWDYQKNKNYQFKFSLIQKLFLSCKLDSSLKQFYSHIEKKMSKVVSLERYIKVIRDVKILYFLLVDSNYKTFLKVCSTPRKNKIFDQRNSNPEILFEELKKKNDKDIILDKIYELLKSG